MADESTDSATMVYVRYINLEKCKISEEFLEMKQVCGHHDASNIFSCLMEVLDPEDPDAKLPMETLAGFTSDGASVMISPKNGVLGKLRSAVNPKVFSTHCPPPSSSSSLKRRPKSSCPMKLKRHSPIHSSLRTVL